MDSPQVSRDLVLWKFKNIIVLLILSIFPGSPNKVTCLFITHIQYISGPFPSEPDRKVSADERCLNFFIKKQLKSINQILFKTWVFSEIRVSKNQGLVSGSPPEGLYFQKMTPKQHIFRKRRNACIFIENGYLFMPFCCFLIPPPPHPTSPLPIPIPIPTPASTWCLKACVESLC